MKDSGPSPVENPPVESTRRAVHATYTEDGASHVRGGALIDLTMSKTQPRLP
jgi:hypothetical protein